MDNFFLRSKHYLLFIPLILPTLLSFYFQVGYMEWMSELQKEMLANPGAPPPFDLSGLADYKGYFLLYLLIFALANFVQLGWWHTVSTKLQGYLPTGTNLKPKRFSIAFTVASAYVIIMLLLQYFAFDWFIEIGSDFFASIEADTPPDFLEDGFIGKFLLTIAGFIVLGFLGLAAMVYLAYYSGKTLRCIEQQKPLQGSAVAGYTILSYFLLIGIWVFQPKVQRLLDTGQMKDPAEEVW